MTNTPGRRRGNINIKPNTNIGTSEQNVTITNNKIQSVGNRFTQTARTNYTPSETYNTNTKISANADNFDGDIPATGNYTNPENVTYYDVRVDNKIKHLPLTQEAIKFYEKVNKDVPEKKQKIAIVGKSDNQYQSPLANTANPHVPFMLSHMTDQKINERFLKDKFKDLSDTELKNKINTYQTGNISHADFKKHYFTEKQPPGTLKFQVHDYVSGTESNKFYNIGANTQRSEFKNALINQKKGQFENALQRIWFGEGKGGSGNKGTKHKAIMDMINNTNFGNMTKSDKKKYKDKLKKQFTDKLKKHNQAVGDGNMRNIYNEGQSYIPNLLGSGGNIQTTTSFTSLDGTTNKIPVTKKIHAGNILEEYKYLGQ